MTHDGQSRNEIIVSPVTELSSPPPVRPLGQTRRRRLLPAVSALLFFTGALLGLGGLLTGFGTISRLGAMTGMLGIGGFVVASMARSAGRGE